MLYIYRFSIVVAVLSLTGAIICIRPDIRPLLGIRENPDGSEGVSNDFGQRGFRERKIPSKGDPDDIVNRARTCRSTAEMRELLHEILTVPEESRFPGDGFEELFKHWLERDPNGALEAVDQIGGLRDMGMHFRAQCFQWAIEAFASNPEVLDQKASQYLKGDGLASFRRTLLYAAGRSNPQAGLKLLERVPKDRQQDLLIALCSSWSIDAPRAAVKELATHGNPSQTPIAYLASTISGANITLADAKWARTEGLPEPFVSTMASYALHHAVVESGVPATLELVRSGSIEVTDFGRLSRTIARLAPVEFLEHMGPLEKLGVFKRVTDSEMVAMNLFEHSQKTGLEFFDKLSASPTVQAQVATVISNQMIRTDANNCSRWLSTLPSGPVRDAALEPMLAYLRSHNETASLAQWEALRSSKK